MTAELVLQRRCRAPVDRLWRGLTSPAALAQWFWPPRSPAWLAAPGSFAG